MIRVTGIYRWDDMTPEEQVEYDGQPLVREWTMCLPGEDGKDHFNPDPPPIPVTLTRIEADGADLDTIVEMVDGIPKPTLRALQCGVVRFTWRGGVYAPLILQVLAALHHAQRTMSPLSPGAAELEGFVATSTLQQTDGREVDHGPV